MIGPIRILLVEDSDADAKLVVQALKRADLDVEVERVEERGALHVALVNKTCDAVICDWSLPGLDALDALSIYRASGSEVPFIIVSGTVGEEQAVTAMRSGAHDYVLKDKLARLPMALEREIRDSNLRTDYRQQERRFRALIEKSSEAIVLSDLAGMIVYASSAASVLYGRRRAELIGQRAMDLVHPDDREVLQGLRLRAHQGEALSGESFRIVRRDGTVRWVEFSATNLLDDPAVCAIVANLRDITERKTAADALRASESRFARLAESGVLGVLTADLHGNIAEVNQAYATMVGYSREELMSGTIKWADLIPPDHSDRIRAAIEHLAQHGAVPPFETATIRKDGVRVPMLIGVAVLELPMYIAFSIDLTERVRAEHALRAAEDQLRQAQKMEAVGRLAGGIAHDFNNILSIIVGYAEMLQEELASGDPRRDDASQILDASKRATSLTRQLLMFSRQQVIEPKVLDLDDVIANMKKMMHRVVGEDVELRADRSQALGRIVADPSSIEQVVMNLVVNARDAMPTGGALTIATGDVELGPEYVTRHIVAHPGNYVRVSVTDTGTGMDAATRARIFEPFFTTKAKEKGTGLGLSTVFGIVHQAGGGIEVESELGAGTTFRIYLPRVEADPTADHASDIGAAKGTETILLLEDDQQVRAVAHTILTRLGYRVIEAATAADAIALCEHHDGTIDLMLSDVVMPHMSGPEVASRIAHLRPDMKVLFMSGYTDDAVVRHGVTTSQIALVQKPFSPVSLTHKIREVLGKAVPA